LPLAASRNRTASSPRRQKKRGSEFTSAMSGRHSPHS
jgi:hypothetical protein